jgi:fatty-acyl-CoA synthase
VRIVVAGAPPPSRTIARIEAELGWQFNQIYGLTETAPLVTVNRPREEYDALEPEERARKLSRAGAPALGTRFAISESGEVLVQSNTVLTGYWNNPDATAEALEGGWFHTGDGGSIDEEGYLTISDRKKDVIITGGENVASIEVEDVIFSNPAVAEVAVIGIPDDKWGELVTALIVRAEGQQATEEEIIAHCRGRIAGYKIPKRVEFREDIPRTATGKIQKFKLRESFWSTSERQVH